MKTNPQIAALVSLLVKYVKKKVFLSEDFIVKDNGELTGESNEELVDIKEIIKQIFYAYEEIMGENDWSLEFIKKKIVNNKEAKIRIEPNALNEEEYGSFKYHLKNICAEHSVNCKGERKDNYVFFTITIL